MKIVRPDGSVVEGSPEEIAQYEAFSRLHNAGGGDASDDGSPEVDWEFVSSDVGFRALTRIKLGKESKAVLNQLHSAGDKWTSAKELQQLVNYSPSQFAGLMGAFGRRVSNTLGYVRDSSFFQYDWDSNQSCYLYRLPPSSRAAIEKARILD
jgi:hypothetical protein